jgi:hypothetical protein
MVIRLTPIGFHRFASDFLQAGVTPSPGDGYSPVPYYCTCRALELGLKSFLLARDVPVQLLKNKYGHNLNALLLAAQTHGIHEFWQPSADDMRQIEIANAQYSSKGFEYFEVIRAVTGYRDLPDLAQLRRITEALLTSTKQLVLEFA